jgi:hypothetical protein
MRPNRQNQYPESLEELHEHLNRCPQQCFDQLKVLIVSEALMCTGPHLEALLLHIQKTNPNCIFLFDGDCQQVTMKPTTGYPTQPFVTRHEFEVACPETTIIILEKCTKHRIKNPIKLQHLGLMRNGQATEATVQYFQQTTRDPQHKKPIIRLFANSKPASAFNEERLTSISRSGNTGSSFVDILNLQAKDTLKGTKEKVKMTASEETSLPVDEVIRVIKGAPILIVQNHIAELISGQKVYVGNGTTGVFWEYDASLDAIFAKVNIASRKELFVRIKRRDFSTTTKTRSQFPFMLAWAATIHKVQGMEFDCIEVDFCLDTRNSGAADFYQGLAYMALSRAETVIVHGKLTVTLLNNINRQSLQWWNRQLSKWIDFKRTKSTPSILFRNAIHLHNFHAAASQKQVHKIVTARAEALVFDPENDANNWETYSEELFDLVPAPASFNPAALPSLRPAGDQASASALAPTLAHVPASAPAPAPLPAPAPASKPPPASVCALTSASAQPPAHKRPYDSHTTGRRTTFTSKFVNVLASAPAPPQPDARKAPPPNPGPRCTPSVFPATMTFSSAKKRKTFPTITEVGDLIEVSS